MMSSLSGPSTSVVSSVFILIILRAPRSTLFPYTTLFRSSLDVGRVGSESGVVVDRAVDSRLPGCGTFGMIGQRGRSDRKSTRLNSSHMSISYAVFCLKKKKLSIIFYNFILKSINLYD